jgi:hypothetical protein
LLGIVPPMTLPNHLLCPEAKVTAEKTLRRRRAENILNGNGEGLKFEWREIIDEKEIMKFIFSVHESILTS